MQELSYLRLVDNHNAATTNSVSVGSVVEPSTQLGAAARVLVGDDIKNQKSSGKISSGNVEDCGGESSEMSTGPTREEIDAKLDKISAQLDTKIEAINGKMDRLSLQVETSMSANSASMNAAVQQIRDSNTYMKDLFTERTDSLEKSVHSVRTNVWAAVAVIAALIIALLAGFPSYFDMGDKVHGIVSHEVTQQINARSAPAPAAMVPPTATPDKPVPVPDKK